MISALSVLAMCSLLAVLTYICTPDSLVWEIVVILLIAYSLYGITLQPLYVGIALATLIKRRNDNNK
jgi:hypothetical protein